MLPPVVIVNTKMTTSKLLPMIILLFHKCILVPLWVLGSAESTAVMKTALSLALTEPTVQRKAKIVQNDQGRGRGEHRVVRTGKWGAYRATGPQGRVRASNVGGSGRAPCRSGPFEFKSEGD